jgi:polar amino acid transport system substrate-binding protein
MSRMGTCAMKKNNSVCVLLAMAVLLVSAAATQAQQAADPRIADIVRAGKVRIGLHLPQFVQDKKTGEIRGSGTGTVIVPIAHALATHMGVKLELVGHPSPPALIDCLKAGACDAGFLGFREARTKLVDYATPHIMVPFTYLVPANSPVRTIADADKPGIRVAAVRDHASTHVLHEVVKHAKMIEVTIPDEAFALVRSGKADAYASPRPPILEYAKQLPGSRVLDGHYGANIQAIAFAKGKADRLAYVSAFVEQARSSGVIQKAINQAGERGIVVYRGDPPILTGAAPGKH